jgi:hypothetical protein
METYIRFDLLIIIYDCAKLFSIEIIKPTLKINDLLTDYANVVSQLTLKKRFGSIRKNWRMVISLVKMGL